MSETHEPSRSGITQTQNILDKFRPLPKRNRNESSEHNDEKKKHSNEANVIPKERQRKLHYGRRKSNKPTRKTQNVRSKAKDAASQETL